MVGEYSLASLIVQAINHAMEHRAQVAATSTQLGMEPPQMDVWQYVVKNGEYRECRLRGGTDNVAGPAAEFNWRESWGFRLDQLF